MGLYEDLAKSRRGEAEYHDRLADAARRDGDFEDEAACRRRAREARRQARRYES